MMMLWLVKNRRFVGAVLAVLISAVLIYRQFKPPSLTVVQTTPTVQTIYVDKPVLTERLIEKILADPKDKAAIAALVAENRALASRVIGLSKTVAEFQSHGGGPVATVAPEPSAAPESGPPPEMATNAIVAALHFKDWRLDFRSDGRTAAYDLTQKFEALATTGRGRDGKPIALVKIYEIGAQGERLPAAHLTTTAIFADETAPHWMARPAVQAGVAVSQQLRGAIIGLQWLKRGRTSAAEDVTLAVLTPVAFIASGTKEIGVLPVSWNLGQLRHQPLKDLWISPYVGISPSSIATRRPSRVGLAISATF